MVKKIGSWEKKRKKKKEKKGEKRENVNGNLLLLGCVSANTDLREMRQIWKCCDDGKSCKVAMWMNKISGRPSDNEPIKNTNTKQHKQFVISQIVRVCFLLVSMSNSTNKQQQQQQQHTKKHDDDNNNKNEDTF